MPNGKHVNGVSDKEQHMYEHIKQSGQKQYGKRTEEVAAATVIKHHKDAGHSQGK